MTAAPPTTVEAMRQRLAFVLAVRGESAGSIVIEGRAEGERYVVALTPRRPITEHPLALTQSGSDEADAVAWAWPRVLDRLAAEVRRLRSSPDGAWAVPMAERALRVARGEGDV